MLSFRTKLLAAMMLMVSAMTSLGLYLSQRTVAAGAERDSQQNFQAELSWLHKIQELRHASLAERCRAVSRNRPRGSFEHADGVALGRRA